jgi:MoxR-like ATPase
VTIGENSYPLDRPFWLLATQNPLEQEGVYVLPEAQVDRFAMKVVVDYPPSEDEARILANPLSEISIDAVIQPEDILQVQETISHIHVDSRVHRYIVAVGRATRVDGSGPPSLKGLVLSGVSTRAFQHVLALVRVIAFLDRRDFVLPEDVKAIAVESMQHRIIRSVHAEAEGVTGADIVNEVLEYVPIP